MSRIDILIATDFTAVRFPARRVRVSPRTSFRALAVQPEDTYFGSFSNARAQLSVISLRVNYRRTKDAAIIASVFWRSTIAFAINRGSI